MKTPVKYRGGKQQLAPKIIPLIPPHECYVEPFFGGGAIFFAKETAKIEVINDIQDNMVNFYKTVKRNFKALQNEIDTTLYSEWQYKEARELWKNPQDKDRILRAWSVFFLSHQCFSGQLGGSWAFSDTGNLARQWDNMKQMFDERYLKRLENTQIFCRDALNVMKNCNSDDTFFFIDPPYFNADMGHCGGYRESDFLALLELLPKLKGKWLLTTCPGDLLAEHTAKNGWFTINNEMHLSASNRVGKTKVEVFTMNCEPPVQQKLL
jgi:DNA adenine methylase